MKSNNKLTKATATNYSKLRKLFLYESNNRYLFDIWLINNGRRDLFHFCGDLFQDMRNLSRLVGLGLQVDTSKLRIFCGAESYVIELDEKSVHKLIKSYYKYVEDLTNSF